MIDVASKKIVHWLCVDDACGSFLAWSLSDRYGITNWQFENYFLSESTMVLFTPLFPCQKYLILSAECSELIFRDYTGMDAIFIPHHSESLSDWLVKMIILVNKIILRYSKFDQVIIWVPQTFLSIPLSLVLLFI